MIPPRAPRSPARTDEGRLSVVPHAPSRVGGTGLQRLDVGRGRQALVKVPSSYRPDGAAPLALMLHGAGADAHHGLRLADTAAERHGVIVLATSSASSTWDLLRGGWGRDVETIDRALDLVFDRWSVDAACLAIGGFSDGASYALSLGFTNGELFTHILAFSPGFMAPADLANKPRCFVSHGTDDRVLPVDRCSRRLVAALRRAGYPVEYREFDGGHEVPGAIAATAVEWFLRADEHERR